MDSSAARRNTGKIRCMWLGSVTSRETPRLREQLFDLLDRAGGTSLWLDVRKVTAVDHAGIGLLISARRRATKAGRNFILVDSAGPVTQALSRLHLLTSFHITERIASDDDLAVDRRSAG
jgi:anti-anti-sigma factor